MSDPNIVARCYVLAEETRKRWLKEELERQKKKLKKRGMRKKRPD